MTLRSASKRTLNSGLRPFGLEIRRIQDPHEGFPTHLLAARRAGMDVNDYLEEVLGWRPATEIIAHIVAPYVHPAATLVEIGPGTGRHARHLAKMMPAGRLQLVEPSRWLADFLRSYFATAPNVSIHRGDGQSIPLPDGGADVAFSNGVFIELNLHYMYLYGREFRRILKPGGVAIIDYIDIGTAGGLDYFREWAQVPQISYTFHRSEAIDCAFAEAGMRVLRRQQIGKSTYVTLQAD